MGACGDLSNQGDFWNRLWKSLRWPYGWWVWDPFNPRRCATGTIVDCTCQSDGDVHINLDVSMDPTSQALLNSANTPNVLVCEIVLADRPNFLDVLGMLAPGQQVQICGRWCLDIGHRWNELHPVDSLTYLFTITPIPLGSLTAYVTDFPNQGPTARVVYVSSDGHVHELYYVASSAGWGTADLTALAGA